MVLPVKKVIEWVYFLSKVYRVVNVHRKTRKKITEMGEILPICYFCFEFVFCCASAVIFIFSALGVSKGPLGQGPFSCRQRHLAVEEGTESK